MVRSLEMLAPARAQAAKSRPRANVARGRSRNNGARDDRAASPHTMRRRSPYPVRQCFNLAVRGCRCVVEAPPGGRRGLADAQHAPAQHVRGEDKDDRQLGDGGRRCPGAQRCRGSSIKHDLIEDAVRCETKPLSKPIAEAASRADRPSCGDERHRGAHPAAIASSDRLKSFFWPLAYVRILCGIKRGQHARVAGCGRG